ncbi:MAG TPA: hypothetical protein ENJ53_10850, partial [Phaeodactylibacter sp.]|nr:hypothetical protein [Phaeodactylibacter sp.]
MLLQNANDSYVDAMIAEIGYPLWDRAVVLNDEENSNQKGVLIPFAKLKDDFISAYILAFVSDSWMSFLVIDKQNVNNIIKGGQPLSYDYFDFHLFGFISFDYQIFGEKEHEYLDLFDLIHEENIAGEPNVSTRSSSTTWTIENCEHVERAFTGNEVDTRTHDCVLIITYFDSCGGVGGGSSFSPFSYGNNLPNYGNSSNTGGAGGGGNSNLSPFQILLNKCEKADTGEPGGNSTTLTDSEMDLCEEVNIISQYTGWGLDHENIAFLFPTEYWSMIAGYLQAGNTGEYSVGMIKTFMQMFHDGTTSLTWKEFMALYNLVVNELKPVLDLDQKEVDLLLNESSTKLANELKRLLDEISDLDDTVPDCEGCSVGQAQTVRAAHNDGREHLECVINQLNNYNGTTPTIIKDALFQEF